MGSINKSHNESDGGILLFQGELILLYCDSVSCEIGGKDSVKGRLYLTTHRMVMIVAPYKPNSAVKSLCAPFCAIIKCSVEQPLFGANYIEATVRDEVEPSRSFSFKLKFPKGGAIEFAMTMNRAVAAVGRNFNPAQPPPPAYTPSPSAQYYQAPPTVYAPGYNTGVQMPVQQFPDAPPIGFIYASSAPPPYPGLGGNAGAQQPPPAYNQGQNTGGYPGQQQNPGYPGQQQNPGYPTQPQNPGYPTQQGGYPDQQQPGAYPGQQQPGSYPGQQQPSGYPNQPPQQQGYPQQTPAYPQAGGFPGAYNQQPAQAPGYQPQQPQPPSAGPGYPTSASGYPNLGGQTSTGYPAQQPAPGAPNDQATKPSAPDFD